MHAMVLNTLKTALAWTELPDPQPPDRAKFA